MSEPAQKPQFDKEVPAIVETMASMECRSRADCDVIDRHIRSCTELSKRIKDWFEPLKKQAHGLWKALLSEEQALVAPLENSKRDLGAKRMRWEREERQRAEEEAKRQSELLSILAEEAMAAAVVDAIADGDDVEAGAIADTPAVAPVTVPAPDVPSSKESGISTAVRWKARVMDLHAFIRWVCEDASRSHMVEPNMVALNALAAAQRDSMSVPGVVAMPVEHIRVRV